MQAGLLHTGLGAADFPRNFKGSDFGGLAKFPPKEAQTFKHKGSVLGGIATLLPIQGYSTLEGLTILPFLHFRPNFPPRQHKRSTMGVWQLSWNFRACRLSWLDQHCPQGSRKVQPKQTSKGGCMGRGGGSRKGFSHLKLVGKRPAWPAIEV